MPDDTGEGSLKLIVASDDPAVAGALREHVRDGELRRIGEAVWLAYTDASTAEIRDWLGSVGDRGPLIVVEFERWSAYGDVDTEWLLRRGH